jgi:hypothetical protein
VNPATKQFSNDDWSNILIGDQSDPSFWKYVRSTVGEIDIFLDDGGHTMDMQRITFENVFPMIRKNGVYACEDLATSYVHQFGGLSGVMAPQSMGSTMISLTQQFVDWLNSYFVDGTFRSREPTNLLSGIARTFALEANSIHFYSQLVVVEKSDGKLGVCVFLSFSLSLSTQLHIHTTTTMVEDKRPGTVRVGGRSIPYSNQPWTGFRVDWDHYLGIVHDLFL